MSASSRDEQALHSGNYSTVLCFRAGPLRSSRMRFLMRYPQEKVGVCAMLVKRFLLLCPLVLIHVTADVTKALNNRIPFVRFIYLFIYKNNC